MPPSLRCSKATPLCAWFGTPSLQPLTTTFHPSLWNTKLYFLKHNENSIQAQIEPQLFLIHVRTCSTRQGTHHWKHSKSNTVQSHKGISLDHMFLPATRVRKDLYCRFGQHLSLQAPSRSTNLSSRTEKEHKIERFWFRFRWLRRGLLWNQVMLGQHVMWTPHQYSCLEQCDYNINWLV